MWLVAAILLLVSAAPAQGAREPVTRGAVVVEPHLAGRQIVWAAPEDGRLVVRAIRPGDAARVLHTVDFPAGGDPDERFSRGLAFGLRASEGRVALFTATYTSAREQTPYVDGSSLLAGPIDGPWTTPPEFCGSTAETGLGLDLDGDRIAFEECSPTFGSHRIIVRDLGTGERLAAVPVDGSVGGVRMAGDYVAVRRQSRGSTADISVVNFRTGQTAYRVRTTYGDFSGLGGQDFAVQADGKLARLTRVEDEYGHEGFRACPAIEWFSPAEPYAHPLPGCPSGRVEMAGDRVVYSTLIGDRRGIVLTDLRDGSLRPIVTGAGQVVPTGAFDFDGTRLAYSLPGCTSADTTTYLDDAAGPEQVEDVRCVVRIARGALTVRADGRAFVDLSCPQGCEGAVSIVRTLRAAPTVGRTRSFSIPAGGSRAVAVRIDSATRKMLRRRRAVAVSVRVRSEDRDAEFVETRRTTTLRLSSRR